MSPTTRTASDGGETGFRCEACGASFETEDALKRHVDTVGLVD